MIQVDKEAYVSPSDTLQNVQHLLDLAAQLDWSDEELYWAVKLLQTMFQD